MSATQHYSYVVAGGACHLCGERAARCVDHLHADPVTSDGPVRGYRCTRCNGGLHLIETLGAERVVAYLGASPIGPAYRLNNVLRSSDKWRRGAIVMHPSTSTIAQDAA